VDHTEWLELKFPGDRPRPVNRVDLYPRIDGANAGTNFPANLTIKVWNGSGWETVLTRTGMPSPGSEGRRFTFA
jgi:hypothetical protein